MTFTQQQFEEFTVHVFEMDSTRMTDWMMEHVDGPRDMYQLMITVAKMIEQTWPMALSVRPGEGESWAMERTKDGSPGEGELIAVQILTAALNADHDAIVGHCRGTCERADDGLLAIQVMAPLLGMYHDGLRAIAQKNEQEAS